MKPPASDSSTRVDPVVLAVIANRFDAIVREMANTLLRAGRSAVLSMGRDFSCSIVTGDNQLLASAEGLPVHVFGSNLQTQAMCDLHPNLSEGDAFLHNDPYLGNTHHADHTILVPVFVDGVHLFTACAKAHQADVGNSLPTTYMPFAKYSTTEETSGNRLQKKSSRLKGIFGGSAEVTRGERGKLIAFGAVGVESQAPRLLISKIAEATEVDWSRAEPVHHLLARFMPVGRGQFAAGGSGSVKRSI